MKKILGLSLALGLLSLRQASGSIYAVGLDKNLYTSDFMIGSVVVSVIFVESDGTVDPNIETWSPERKNQVLSEIMTGLDWWTQQNQKSKLSFTYVSDTVTTRYEPITRPYYDEALWIPEIMGKLGHTGTRWQSTRDYVNTLRNQYHTDWGVVIFMVDSLQDSNGKMADGFFAYSYLGGPFSVMTYDNNGYGIANMDVVAAHEMGHIFNALDEYAGASSPSSYSMGYFPTINGNHAYAATGTDANSIMRGGIRWGLDPYAKLMVGWRDNDNNGRDDIIDQQPSLSVSQQTATSSDGSVGFNGIAKLRVLPRQSNSNGHGFTVDTISKVEYRVQGGAWGIADPSDGIYDGAEETFQITIPASQATLSSKAVISSSDLDVRVVTTFSVYVGGSSAGGPSTTGTLSEAHPYPNPYKPNSALGHSSVQFTHLTHGAKVQIFSPSGAPVFEKQADSLGSNVTWDNVSEVDSGVYYFLITDPAGDKKKGKIAVIK